MSIDTDSGLLPISRQCELLGLARSTFYYKSWGTSAYNLQLMRLLDEQYTRTPFYGIRKMTAWLDQQGHHVNHKRVRRLLRLMGLEAIYPKRRRLSMPDSSHKIYPYLLNGLAITRSNQVWASDITYIRMKTGFLYLVAVMDWYSRYVLSWALSNSLETAFCTEALERALRMGSPEIFNSDQGTQFTSEVFTAILRANGVRISMDGRGRVFDNIFIERLWRTLKYEEVYLKEYTTVREATENLARYFHFYNWERIHESLGYKTPHQVYYSTSNTKGKGGYIHANLTP
jgi:putative transposase